MSTTPATRKPPARRRGDSDELDVFEAARYLSGASDCAIGFGSKAAATKEERAAATTRERGISSFDVPVDHSETASSGDHRDPVKKMVEEKKGNCRKANRMPASPGGKLARFLSSLFHHAAGSKKKSERDPSFSTLSRMGTNEDEDEEEESSTVWRRKRRSSTSATSDVMNIRGSREPKSLYYCKSTGFRTPPHSLAMPQQSKLVSGPPSTADTCFFGQKGSAPAAPVDTKRAGAAAAADGLWASERFKVYGGQWERSRAYSFNGFLEKGSRIHVREVLEQDEICGGGSAAEKKWTLNKGGMPWVERCRPAGGAEEVMDPWRSEEADDDDGGESDSSSDLFELPSMGGRSGPDRQEESTATVVGK